MSEFVQISDFKLGRFEIALTRDTEAQLQEYIDNSEKSIILQLLGITMGEALYATPALYPELQAPFTEEINGCFVESKGLKFILQGLIYFEYMRDQTVKSTTTGSKATKGELSSSVNFASADYTTRYNNSIDSYKAIQIKCIYNEDAYPDFDGQEKQYILPI